MKRKESPPQVVTLDCTGCERCVAVCPSFVLEMTGGKSIVARGEWCIGCGHCEAVCPADAIYRGEKPSAKEPGRGEAPSVGPEPLELLLRERRSVRIYSPDLVSKEVLDRVINAGRYAPTGRNSQNVCYVVLTSPERIAALQKMTISFYDKVFSRVRGRLGMLLFSFVAGRKTAEYLRESLPKVEVANQKMRQGRDRLFYHAPVVMLAHAESWDSCSSFNCSVALYHCSLMAHALGLGCCFNFFLVNAVNRVRRMKEWLGIPEDHRCYSAMTLGYPDVTYLRMVRRLPPEVAWD